MAIVADGIAVPVGGAEGREPVMIRNPGSAGRRLELKIGNASSGAGTYQSHMTASTGRPPVITAAGPVETPGPLTAGAARTEASWPVSGRR
jgi:hypothetical protein